MKVPTRNIKCKYFKLLPVKKENFNYVEILLINSAYYPSIFLITSITSAAKK